MTLEQTSLIYHTWEVSSFQDTYFYAKLTRVVVYNAQNTWIQVQLKINRFIK